MNKLSSFLDNYADYFKTIHKIGDYVTENGHFLVSKENGGGFAELGESVHSDIKMAINRTVVPWSEFNDATIRESIENDAREQLLRNISDAIREHADIKRDCIGKSYDQIAQDFIDIMFEPLLDKAKDIDRDLVVAQYRGRTK